MFSMNHGPRRATGSPWSWLLSLWDLSLAVGVCRAASAMLLGSCHSGCERLDLGMGNELGGLASH